MKISYDLTALPERRCAMKESEEVTAIKAFLAGKQKNMCFEYEDEKQAKRRYDTVRNFRLHNNLKEVFDLYRHEKCIYVLRIKKTGTPGPVKRKVPPPMVQTSKAASK